MRCTSREDGVREPSSCWDMGKLGERVSGGGSKMGEGWLLPSEMMELCDSGFENIVCAQPFGCLPNHIVGKAMVQKIRAIYEKSNIVAIDYDPGATRVNQENRLKLMLAIARENLACAQADKTDDSLAHAAG